MSLFQDIMYAIDTPGALLRGVLAGKPGHRATGRDVLRLRQNQPGLDAGDVAGFLAETLLDPLNLVPFGALLRVGKPLAKAARAAGPRYAVNFAKNPLQGEVSPFMAPFVPPAAVLGGKGAEATVALTPGGRAIRMEHMAGPHRRFASMAPRRVVHPAILQPSQAMLVADRFVVENLPHAISGDKLLESAIRRRHRDIAAGTLPPLRHEALTNYARRKTPYGNRLTNTFLTPEQRAELLKRVAVNEAEERAFRIGKRLDKSLSNRGISWEDRAVRNWGTVGHHAYVIDPGFMYRKMPSEAIGPVDTSIALRVSGSPSLPEAISPAREYPLPMIPLEPQSPVTPATRLADLLGYRTMARKEWEGLPARDPTLRNAILGTAASRVPIDLLRALAASRQNDQT